MVERSKKNKGHRDRSRHPDPIASPAFPVSPEDAFVGDAAFYLLDEQHIDPARLRHERDKARHLRKSPWWASVLQKGVCYYCDKQFPPDQLTMDHVVPLARGGSSTRGNTVAACAACNRDKKLNTPVDGLLESLRDKK